MMVKSTFDVEWQIVKHHLCTVLHQWLLVSSGASLAIKTGNHHQASLEYTNYKESISMAWCPQAIPTIIIFDGKTLTMKLLAFRTYVHVYMQLRLEVWSIFLANCWFVARSACIWSVPAIGLDTQTCICSSIYSLTIIDLFSIIASMHIHSTQALGIDKLMFPMVFGYSE